MISKQPTQHRWKQSASDAAAYYRGKHLKTATLIWAPGVRSLHLKVDLRPLDWAEEIRRQLVGETAWDGHRKHGQLHVEILGDEGRKSFLLRLIRRWPGQEEARRCPKLVIRIGGGPLIVTDGISEDTGEDCSLDSSTFLRLFRQSRECVLFLSGMHISIGTIYCIDRLHHVGCDVAEIEAVGREVIDIN
jgi:hypothetical protein